MLSNARRPDGHSGGGGGSGDGSSQDGDRVQFNSIARMELEREAVQAESSTSRRRFVRGLLVGVIGVVAVAAIAAVVVWNVHGTASTSLRIPDEFQAQFHAKAVQTETQGQDFVDAQPVYVGTIHKQQGAGGEWVLDGVMSFTEGNNKTEVTMVNNRAYYTYTDTETKEVLGAGCVTEDNLPWWEDLQNAFDSATEISAHEQVVDHIEDQCKGQQKYVLDWGGMIYVFCAVKGTDGSSYEFIGEEFAANIFDVKTKDFEEIVVPDNTTGLALQCPELQPRPSSRRRLLRSRSLARRLATATTDAEASVSASRAASPSDLWFLKSEQEARAKRRRLGKKKACVFLHGLGHADNLPSGGSHSYWGQAHKWAKCSSYTFIKRDTKNVRFDDPALLSHVCTEAGGPTISNKIIFTHSMGSLIMAAALQNNTCQLSSSTEWYQVQGPLAGAKAASVVTQMCSKSILSWLANVMGFCDSESMNSLLPSYTDFAKYSTTLNNNIHGAMCGKSAWGLNTLYSVPIAAANKIINFAGSSDGIVGWSECDFHMPGSFGTHYNDRFYKPSVNHLDGTCRNGNGWIPWWGGGNHRQPCRWFESMTK